MSDREKVFIVNPNAGNGACGSIWQLIESLARKRLGTFRSLITQKRDDARQMASMAVADGARLIVCVGGDGTLNEVVNGMMETDRAGRRSPVLAWVPTGSGFDLSRTLSIPMAPATAVEVIAVGRTRLLDIGRIIFKDQTGCYRCRYFHNIASFGLGGEVADRVNRSTKIFGPFFSFIWALLATIVLYDRKRILLKIGDRILGEHTVLNIAVANGQYHGGGMRVVPDARIDDGRFHVTVIGDLSLPEVLINLPRLYNGRITECRKVKSYTGRKVEAFTGQTVLLDVDGEQPGKLPAAFDLLPGAVKIVASG